MSIGPLLIQEVPHWKVNWPEELWPYFEDFRVFLSAVWDHLGLPEPTEAQYEIAHTLQHGVDTAQWDQGIRRDDTLPMELIIRAFRGLGKSYTTSAFVVWCLMRNPRDEKILVVSATGSKAKEFVDQTKGIMQSMLLCRWLLTGTRESGAARRDKTDEFDVAGASITQSHSVTARGITGQITGSRATKLIADDIEIESNSLTEEARGKIIRVMTNDFNPITKTEHGKGDQLLLGTPRTEESVYNYAVTEMGFDCMCIPARMPAEDKMVNYQLRRNTGELVDILAPYLKAKGLPPGVPTDERFPEDELIRTEAKGRSSFALQYMLDTTLSDAERYPLRQEDLIVYPVNIQKAPVTIQWGRDTDKKNFIRDIPNLGFRGDQLLGPLFVDSDWWPYEDTVMFVDPSGRGADETAWAIGSHLSGMIWVHEVEGHRGEPAEAMRKAALDAYRYKVNTIYIEPNYAQGVWQTAFQGILETMQTATHMPYLKEAEWASGQKELRIIGVLEPAMNSHRVVLNEEVVRREANKSRATEDYMYSLMYQMTHLTKDRGSLKHDDRIEALSGLIQVLEKTVGEDVEASRQAIFEQQMQDEIDDFIENYSQGPGGFRRRSGRVTRARGRRPDTEVYIVD